MSLIPITRERVTKRAVLLGAVGLSSIVGISALARVVPMPPILATEAVDRAPREFRASRPESEGEQDDLASTIEWIIEGVVAEPELPPARERELVEELLVALHDQGIGSPNRRAEAAREAIASIAEAASQFAGGHSGPDELRRRAIRQQSASLRRTLLQNTGHAAARPLSFRPRPEGYRRLIWNELTDIAYAEGDPLPPEVLALDGERVAMAGFFVDLGSEGQVLLVRSVWSCCFGEPPEIHEAVVVTVEGKVEDAWFDEVVRVAGTLEVGEDWDGDFLLSVYRMRATQIDVLQQ